MNDSRKKHVELVNKWLEENVQVFSEPELVTLSEFSINWEDFGGDFRVALDSNILPDKFNFWLEASGLTRFCIPMFHSPLGAPASYGAVRITNKTNDAILQGLRDTIPRLEGVGISKKTGMRIELRTPPIERIEKNILEQVQNKVSQEGYSITVEMKSIKVRSGLS